MRLRTWEHGKSKLIGSSLLFIFCYFVYFIVITFVTSVFKAKTRFEFYDLSFYFFPKCLLGGVPYVTTVRKK